MELILNYFPELSKEQKDSLQQLKQLYETQNALVNVISRKDIDALYLHHVLHSLTITKFIQLNAQCKLLDLGTGGGFPAIPLAIYYPDIFFTAIDGTGKKIKVANQIAEALNLKNIKFLHLRAEEYKENVNFVVSRAVCSLDQLCNYSKSIIKKQSITALPNGVIAYKGGDLNEELKAIKNKAYYEIWDIYDLFPEAYFLEKKLVYLQLHE
ncbi:MAG: 16S rRNA (guanine(527)-N(7))-methyltransferase RsmG [Saprospiraceae bacterium]|nr:16S rRNA (guanine(527)-N(7))-methyltransferase RsmG [Saprospiraceae bacterium]